MGDILVHLIDAPFPNLLIVAGLGFLAVGVIGKISANIAPGTGGRIMSGILGVILTVYGVQTHVNSDKKAANQAAASRRAGH